MSQAVATRTWLADNQAMNSNVQAFSFRSNTLVKQRTFARDDGHRGSRQQSSCRARVQQESVSGSVVGYMSVAELDWILPRSIGASGSSPWAPAESLAAIYAVVDKVAAKYRYDGLRVASLELNGRETSPFTWTVNLVGEQEAVFTSANPSGAVPCESMYMFHDCVLNIGGTPYPIKSIRMNIDNSLDSQDYENSLTPSRFEAQDLAITLSVETAFRSDTLALYNRAVAGDAGSLVLSDGVVSYTFAFANLKIPESGPTVPDSGKITMPLTMMAYRTNGTDPTDNQLLITKTVL